MMHKRVAIRLVSIGLAALVAATSWAEPSATPSGSVAADAPERAPVVAPPDADATAVEYGLIAALVAVVIIGALTELGSALTTTFFEVCADVENGCPPEGENPDPDGDGEATMEESAESESGAMVSESMAVSTNELATSVQDSLLVVNGSESPDQPDAGARRELSVVKTLVAESTPETPPGEKAIVRLDVVFPNMFWGINGPIPLQDGRFEIEGPEGELWGFAIEHDVELDALVVTELIGTAELDDLVFFDGSGGSIDMHGLTFDEGQALVEIVNGPSFEFELPYDEPTDVKLTLRRTSHAIALPEPAPAVTLAVGVAALVALARRRERRLARVGVHADPAR